MHPNVKSRTIHAGARMAIFLNRMLPNMMLVFVLAVSVGNADAQIRDSFGEARQLLDRSINKIDISNATISDVVHVLRSTYRIPISFIETPESKKFDLELPSGTLGSVLEAATARDPAYQLKVLRGRVVLLPASPEFDEVIAIDKAAELSRIDLAELIAAEFSNKTKLFGDLIPPPIRGDSRVSVYSEKISMERTDTVLGYLVQLLGDDENVMFSIVKTKSGRLVILLDKIQQDAPVLKPQP